MVSLRYQISLLQWIYLVLVVALLAAIFAGYPNLEPAIRGCLTPILLLLGYGYVRQGGKDTNFFSRNTSKFIFGLGFVAVLLADAFMHFEAYETFFTIAIVSYAVFYGCMAWLFFTIANKQIQLNWFLITVTIITITIVVFVLLATWEGIKTFQWGMVCYAFVFIVFVLSCMNAAASTYVWPERSLYILGGAFFTIISQVLEAFSKFSPMQNMLSDLLIIALYYVAQWCIVKGLLEKRNTKPIL